MISARQTAGVLWLDKRSIRNSCSSRRRRRTIEAKKTTIVKRDHPINEMPPEGFNIVYIRTITYKYTQMLAKSNTVYFR